MAGCVRVLRNCLRGKMPGSLSVPPAGHRFHAGSLSTQSAPAEDGGRRQQQSWVDDTWSYAVPGVRWHLCVRSQHAGQQQQGRNNRRQHIHGPATVSLAGFFGLGFLFGSTDNDSGKDDGGGSEQVELSPLEEALRKADELDVASQFKSEYELLAGLENSDDNPEVLWRIARSIIYGFEFSLVGVTQPQYIALIKQAHSKALRAVELAPESKSCLLWCGIGGFLELDYGHTSGRAKKLTQIKQHLTKAVELDPSNPVAWHWLGRWHFVAADEQYYLSLTGFILFEKTPPSTYYDALICYHQAETLSPGFRVDNLWQMVMTYFRLLDMEKAYTILWHIMETKAFTELERTSRDYAKRYLRAYFDEETYDSYDMPRAFYAKLMFNEVKHYDIKAEKELRDKETAIRKSMKEKEQQARKEKEGKELT